MKYLTNKDLQELRFLVSARASKLRDDQFYKDALGAEINMLEELKAKIEREIIAHNYYYEGKEA